MENLTESKPEGFSPINLTFSQNDLGEYYIYAVNRNVFEQLDSATVFKQAYGDRIFQEDTLYIIPGTDSGLLPRYLVDKGLPAGSAYLFLELPDVLETLAKKNLLPEHPKIYFATAEEWLSRAKDIGLDKYLFIDRVSLMKSMAAQDAHLAGYLEMSWELTSALERFRWEAAATLGNESFYRCQLENLADNQLPASYLKGIFAGETAVLLAGGPSLDDLLPWVQTNRDRLVVLAVSRVARRLIELGVTPDIIFSIDPTELSFDVSREMLRLPECTLFVHLYHVFPGLLAQWRGRSMYLGQRVPWESELNEPTLPSPGPTVTNVALATGVAMGFARIILAGVDLCFSPEGHSHAEGSNERKAGPRIGGANQEVLTNAGKHAPTSSDFHNAIKVLAHQAQAAKQHGCQFINPSPNAAKVEDVAHTPVADIHLSDSAGEPADRIGQAMPENNHTSRTAHYARSRKALQHARHQLNRLGALAEMAIEYNRQFFETDDLAQRRTLKSKLDRIERLFEQRFRDFATLTIKFGIRDFLKAVKPSHGKDMESDEAKRVGHVYYQAYLHGSQRFVRLIDKGLEILKCREREEEEAPDFDMMAQCWVQHNQPGRALVWKTNHPDRFLVLKEETKNQFNDLMAAFEAQLTCEDTGHMARIRRLSGLPLSKGRAEVLFKRRDIEGLRNLRKLVANHPSEIETAPYLALIDGFVLELEGRTDEAMERFTWIAEHSDNQALLEEAFREIGSMALSQGAPSVAEMALQCLVRISPIYLPPLADFQRTLRRYRDAADTLADYLALFPEDTSAMLKLVDLYLNVNLPDSARVLILHLLEIEPENETARQVLDRLEKQLCH